jgi:hypothetical protein
MIVVMKGKKVFVVETNRYPPKNQYVQKRCCSLH